MIQRGVRRSRSKESQMAMADYTAVLDFPDVSIAHIALALNNRAAEHGDSGDRTKQVADYSRVIDLPDVPIRERKPMYFALSRDGQGSGRREWPRDRRLHPADRFAQSAHRDVGSAGSSAQRKNQTPDQEGARADLTAAINLARRRPRWRASSPSVARPGGVRISSRSDRRLHRYRHIVGSAARNGGDGAIEQSPFKGAQSRCERRNSDYTAAVNLIGPNGNIGPLPGTRVVSCS